jgi:hypothetical protein
MDPILVEQERQRIAKMVARRNKELEALMLVI